MIKKLTSIFILALSCVILVSCNSDNKNISNEPKSQTREMKIVVPDGLPAIGAAELIKNNTEIDNYKLNFSIEKTTENLVSSVLKNEPDIAIVPSNIAATSFNKSGEYKIAATTGFGSFYLISTDGTKDIKDLKGKEIYNIGKGLTPDIVTKTLLEKMGYKEDKDFNFSYVNGVTELAPAVLSGKVKYAVVPEPALSQIEAKKKVTVILNLNEKWKELFKSNYGFPQATVIVKKDLITNHQMFLEDFLKNLKESVDFANSKGKDLGTICSDIGVSVKGDIIAKSIDKANLKYVPIKDSIDEYNDYFRILNDFSPKSIGGKVPSEEIYLQK